MPLEPHTTVQAPAVGLEEFHRSFAPRSDGFYDAIGYVGGPPGGFGVAWNSATGELVALHRSGGVAVLAIVADRGLADTVAGAARTPVELERALARWQRLGPAGFGRPPQPYLRPWREGAPVEPVPPGWEIRAVGLFEGPGREVVFDPVRHDVLTAPPRTFAGREHELGDSGWRALGGWGGGEVWVRDRQAATRAALDRLHHDCPVVALGSRGLA